MCYIKENQSMSLNLNGKLEINWEHLFCSCYALEGLTCHKRCHTPFPALLPLVHTALRVELLQKTLCPFFGCENRNSRCSRLCRIAKPQHFKPWLLVKLVILLHPYSCVACTQYQHFISHILLQISDVFRPVTKFTSRHGWVVGVTDFAPFVGDREKLTRGVMTVSFAPEWVVNNNNNNRPCFWSNSSIFSRTSFLILAKRARASCRQRSTRRYS